MFIVSFLFVSIYIVYDLDAHPVHQYITLPRYRKYLCCKKPIYLVFCWRSWFSWPDAIKRYFRFNYG